MVVKYIAFLRSKGVDLNALFDRIIALFVPGGRVQGTIYRKPVYEREAGLYLSLIHI